MKKIKSVLGSAKSDSMTYLTGPNPNGPLPPGSASWPVVQAWVPVADVWKATGCGTVGIIRRDPEGKLWSTFAPIQMTLDGIMSVIGDNAKAEIDVDFLSKFADSIPPSEPGSAALAARYAWGAYAFSRVRGANWPAEVTERFLNLFPRIPGGRTAWIEQFVEKNALVSREFLQMLQRFPTPDDMPEGKEVIVVTTATFNLADTAGAKAALLAETENFAFGQDEGSTSVFYRMKARRVDPSRKVKFGSIEISEGKLVMQGPTLSAAAEIIDLLRRVIGPGLTLRGTRWGDAKDLKFMPPGMTSMPQGR